MVVPRASQQPPYWVWNAAMSQLYLSTFHLSSATVSHYVRALERFGVRYLLAYPSALNVMARHMMEAGLTVPLKVTIANAEPVFDYQKRAAERAFGCTLRETYGMAEIAAAAGECESGVLHFWPESGWSEVLNQQAVDGPGELVCTSLLNADMPLIRYASGDRTTPVKWAGKCVCGRTLPRVSRIEGRSNDRLIAEDGRPVFWLNPAFYGLPVLEAQIVQESRSNVRVLYVPDEQFTADTASLIVERLQRQLGDLNFHLEPTVRIPREANGKFRAIVCRVAARQSGI